MSYRSGRDRCSRERRRNARRRNWKSRSLAKTRRRDRRRYRLGRDSCSLRRTATSSRRRRRHQGEHYNSVEKIKHTRSFDKTKLLLSFSQVYFNGIDGTGSLAEDRGANNTDGEERAGPGNTTATGTIGADNQARGGKSQTSGGTAR